MNIIDNLTIYPRTDNVAEFYNEASLVLNLSNPDEFIETFGLTALEAMRDALPVIVPPAGGIAEMVNDGENGYKIDCRDTDRLVKTIRIILEDKALYENLSANALSYSEKFSRKEMIDRIISLLR